ncbi:hypothetical protein [Actinomadura nitritigenes]|uniref:hypothetical protein n=1 Tax=Actinomadura nitritigenes TaxID=134602 RepID=UPI003D916D5E
MSNPRDRRGGWSVIVVHAMLWLQALLIGVPGVKMLALGWPSLGSTDEYGSELAWLLVVSSCVPLLASGFGLYLAFAFRSGNPHARQYIVLYEATVVLVTLLLAFLAARPHFRSISDQRSPRSIWSPHALGSPNHLWFLGVLVLGVFVLVSMRSPVACGRGDDGPPP